MRFRKEVGDLVEWYGIVLYMASWNDLYFADMGLKMTCKWPDSDIWEN